MHCLAVACALDLLQSLDLATLTGWVYLVNFDFLLYATLTSGTTRENKDYQRDYLLTMEMVNLQNGQYDKESATLTKGYHHSRTSRWLSSMKS